MLWTAGEEKGGVPSRLLKTDAGDDRQGRHAMTMFAGSPSGRRTRRITLALDELAREGARRMIAAALRAEANEYVARYEDEVDEDWAPAGGPQRPGAGAAGDGRVGDDPGPRAAGERQARRGGDG